MGKASNFWTPYTYAQKNDDGNLVLMMEVCTTARELITRNPMPIHAEFIDEHELLFHPLVPMARDHYRCRQ